jgi:hypothetical protein
MHRRLRNYWWVYSAIALLGCRLLSKPAKPQPPASPVDISSCEIPRDAALPQTAGDDQRGPMYDYAWRSFIALICSADTAKGRGVEASPQDFAKAPHVFETYKSSWEIFPSVDQYAEGTALPKLAGPDEYAAADFNPCGVAGSPDMLTLGSISKFADVAQAGTGEAPLSPVVSQNGKYVHYLTLYNPTAFKEILNKSLYLAQNVGGAVNFPPGSIILKSAWIETDGLSQAAISRFYTRQAMVQSPAGGCHKRTQVALVGLHFVQKTPSRGWRIWTTFEHEDNVPYCAADQICAPDAPPPAGYTFYKQGEHMPVPNPFDPLGRKLPSQPVPFTIERFHGIAPATKCANDAYIAVIRQKLGADSVWAHYRLVMAQWPNETNCTKDCSFFNTMPWTWTNPIIETYFQTKYDTGTCGTCHHIPGSDFVWSLQIDSYPQTATRANALKTLMSLYQSHVESFK